MIDARITLAPLILHCAWLQALGCLPQIHDPSGSFLLAVAPAHDSVLCIVVILECITALRLAAVGGSNMEAEELAAEAHPRVIGYLHSPALHRALRHDVGVGGPCLVVPEDGLMPVARE